MNYERTIVRLRQLAGTGEALRDNAYVSDDAVEAWETKVLVELEDRPDLQERFLTNPPATALDLLSKTFGVDPDHSIHYRRVKNRLRQPEWIIARLKHERFPTTVGPSPSIPSQVPEQPTEA